MPVITLLNDWLIGFLPPLLAVSLWAMLSAVFSMLIYAKISPQQKMLAAKDAQRASRKALLAYDGNLRGMYALIGKDLRLSLRMIGMAIIPFALAALPVMGLMLALSPLYPNTLTTIGPEWMQGFDFWYIVVLIVVSLIIKITFRIT